MSGDRILLVEDDLPSRNVCAMCLRAEGYDVSDAANGEQAVELINVNDYDLVLTDLMMGTINGLDVIKKAKRKDPNCGAILMTAYGTIESNVEAMKLGASGYIIKPINTDELCLKIKDALGYRRSHSLEPVENRPAGFNLKENTVSSLMLLTMLKIILKSSCEVLSADGGSLLLYREDSLHVAAISDNFKDEIMGKTIEPDDGIIGKVFLSGKPIVVNNEVEANPFFNGYKMFQKVRSGISLPLIHENCSVGVLNLSRTAAKVEFTESDFDAAAVFANNAVIAINNANASNDLREAYNKLEVAQDQLIQAEKMSAIGRVTSSIAHELNNPLVSVLGNAQLLLDEIPKDNPWWKDISEIEYCAQRCKNVINNFLGFSRKGKHSFKKTDILAVVKKALEISEYQLSIANIKLIKHYNADLPPVWISPSHIEQVFINLILNAQQAMSDGGRLIIKCYTKKIDEILRRKTDVMKHGDSVVCVEFVDSGIGIISEDLSKIMEPFFTTKDEGKGTGLGLSICHDIISKNYGSIEIESPGVNKGTRVIVNLSLAKEKSL